MEIIPFKSSTVYYNSFSSPFGPGVIACTTAGICSLSFTENIEMGFKQLFNAFPNEYLFHKEHPSHIKALDVFYSEKAPDLTLCVLGTPFQLKIWTALLSIPRGETVNYADLALKTGNPKAFRAVGSAIGKNPVAVLIPCHRVLPKSGETGNYRWGKDLKISLLNWEQNGTLPVNG